MPDPSTPKKFLLRLDPKTGTIENTTQMPRGYQWRASPIGADGKIWCINHGGVVAIIDAKSGEVLKTIEMGEKSAGKDEYGIRASIVIAHGNLFIRTIDSLYCIGQ